MIIDDAYIILVIYLNLIIILHISKYHYKNTSNEFHGSNVDNPDAGFIRLRCFICDKIKTWRDSYRFDDYLYARQYLKLAPQIYILILSPILSRYYSKYFKKVKQADYKTFE